MKLLRTLVSLLVLVAAVALGVLFALQNTQPVPLDVLLYRFGERSLALWVLLALGLGALLGLLASSLMMLRLRARLATSRRHLERAQTELDRLRVGGIKDSE